MPLGVLSSDDAERRLAFVRRPIGVILDEPPMLGDTDVTRISLYMITADHAAQMRQLNRVGALTPFTIDMTMCKRAVPTSALLPWLAETARENFRLFTGASGGNSRTLLFTAADVITYLVRANNHVLTANPVLLLGSHRSQRATAPDWVLHTAGLIWSELGIDLRAFIGLPLPAAADDESAPRGTKRRVAGEEGEAPEEEEGGDQEKDGGNGKKEAGEEKKKGEEGKEAMAVDGAVVPGSDPAWPAYTRANIAPALRIASLQRCKMYELRPDSLLARLCPPALAATPHDTLPNRPSMPVRCDTGERLRQPATNEQWVRAQPELNAAGAYDVAAPSAHPPVRRTASSSSSSASSASLSSSRHSSSSSQYATFYPSPPPQQKSRRTRMENEYDDVDSSEGGYVASLDDDSDQGDDEWIKGPAPLPTSAKRPAAAARSGNGGGGGGVRGGTRAAAAAPPPSMLYDDDDDLRED